MLFYYCFSLVFESRIKPLLHIITEIGINCFLQPPTHKTLGKNPEHIGKITVEVSTCEVIHVLYKKSQPVQRQRMVFAEYSAREVGIGLKREI